MNSGPTHLFVAGLGVGGSNSARGLTIRYSLDGFLWGAFRFRWPQTEVAAELPVLLSVEVDGLGGNFGGATSLLLLLFVSIIGDDDLGSDGGLGRVEVSEAVLKLDELEFSLENSMWEISTSSTRVGGREGGGGGCGCLPLSSDCHPSVTLHSCATNCEIGDVPTRLRSC